MDDMSRSAELAIYNASIITMNSSKPRAQSLSTMNERFLVVGSNRQVKRTLRKDTFTIDLRGKTVLPGLIDCHVHLVKYGLQKTEIDLRNVKSIRELKRRLERRVGSSAKGSWIIGHGWDQDRFEEKRYPTKIDLDEVAEENPVVLTRVCGHICVVNTAALRIANISREIGPIQGGQIDRDHDTGEPTGILRESAQDLVWKVVPQPTLKELEDAILAACRDAVKVGLTSIHCLVDSSSEITALHMLRKRKSLPLRLSILPPRELLDSLVALGIATGFGDDYLRLGPVKIFADGSLGARTAALTEDYSDDPGNKGITIFSQDELNAIVDKAHRSNLQVAIHAVGDRAVEFALTALENTLVRFPKKDHRHRIEHASVLNRSLIKRMRDANAIASIQPTFTISDFWVPQRVGPERVRLVYPFKTLMKSRVLIAASSDCPTEILNPILGIHAAVTRGGFVPEESLNVNEAIEAFTVDAAYASFEEESKGSIEVGKLADFVVLSEDITQIPLERIKDVRVEMTVIGGRIVYMRRGFVTRSCP
jgi:predicted amidohydrolase YtcJ